MCVCVCVCEREREREREGRVCFFSSLYLRVVTLESRYVLVGRERKVYTLLSLCLLTGTLSLHARKHGYQPGPFQNPRDRPQVLDNRSEAAADFSSPELEPTFSRDQRRIRRSVVWEYFTAILVGEEEEKKK